MTSINNDNESYGSRRDLVRRRGAPGSSQASTTDRSGQKMYQPGTPIGYIAARGTPYEKKYFTKKLGFCCLFLAPPVLAVVGVITLVPVLWAIARHALHTSQLHVYESNITAITNTSFPLTIKGQVKKTGIFPAHLAFRKPVDVYWNTPPPNMREVHLGHFNLATLGAAAGHATVYQATTFFIDDTEGFGTFAEYLVSQPQFTWQVRCAEVHAEGFSFFPVYKALKFVKNVVINGLNNFEDVKILDLQLPGNDPAGGLQAIATASLRNPSPFGVEVGTLNLALYYKGLYLGPVQGTNINITAGINVITLYGRVISYANDQPALELLGELFTNYINSVSSPVIARGVSTQQANGETIAWLSQGIKALTTTIPFVPPKPIDPIKGIIINYLSLVYSVETPFNPVLFSNRLTGTFALPFGFSLNITDLATQINVFYQGALVGTASGPYGNSSTNIQLISTGQTAGTIDLTLPPTQLTLPNTTDAAKKQLIQFQNAFTYSVQADFIAQGMAKAVTDTPIGRILLNGIKFNITTGLQGLNGLATYPTIINSVDVVGGAPDAVSLVVGLTAVNPSNLNLSTGDATFQLINQMPLGNATLPGLILTPGRNDINSTSFFDPNRAPIGLETLNRFISGLDTYLNISGFAGSSAIESLAPTLEGIRLNTTLPGLKQNLAQAANLTVLDSTGIIDDVANSHVQLYNPFTAPITITSIAANATSRGIYIANINTPLNFPAAGKAVTTSPVVPLVLNLYPPDLFGLLRQYILESNQNPAYLDGLVQLAGYTLTPTTPATPVARRKRDLDDSFVLEEDDSMAQMLMGVGSNPGALTEFTEESATVDDEVDDDSLSDGVAKRANALSYDGVTFQKRANLYTGFDITTYVGNAFRIATADLTIVSDAVIGQYGTTLTFSQNNVPLGTDATLFKLLPPLALPIVQKVVDGSILNVDRVTITEAAPTTFTAALQGALTNAGPFDAVVTFPQGLDIYWEGQLLTSAAFPNISLVGDTGSSLNVIVQGNIPDVPFFTRFLQYAITNPSFVWNIRGQGISVAALGIVVSGVTINKDVQLAGLNNLRGNVIINSFDVPFNDPAGGLHLTAVSTINNPAQVGVSLTQFGTQIFMGQTGIGPAASDGAFTLQALAVTTVPLVGRIVQQNDPTGLAALSDIFTRFVQNKNTDVIVNGDFAGPSDVVWLNEGIKALSVVVSLPAQDFQVIRLVSINQLSLFFTVPTAWAPMSDTSDTEAHFFLPFAIPVDIQSVAGPFIANYQTTQMAVLNIPTSPTATDVEARILRLVFNNVPFSVYDPAHAVFSQFVADVTAGSQVTFNLNGMATGVANTAAGTITISDIPFNLNTNILGLQNLNARPANVSNLDVVRGYPTYLMITVNTELYNPSDITIGAGNIQFAALFQNNVIGAALINDVLLVPGTNNVPTQINYMPVGAQNVRSGQTLLENYVGNISSDAVVQGNSQTTPIPSLLQGLSGITLTAVIPPLFKLIVIQAALEVPRNIAQTGVASASVMIANPFTASINIIGLQAQAVYQDITIGNINQDLSADPIRAPGKVTTMSRTVPINLNIDPKVLIRFIEAAAAAAGVSLGPLPPFFQQVLDLPDTRTTISPFPDDTAPPYNPSCNSGRAFDTLGAILTLLKPLAATIPIQSVVKIDEYQTNLNFVQAPVPVATDNSALYLVGPAGAPLIQLIVNQAVLTVTQANATALTNAGFAADLAGSLMTNAPADAIIEFVDPVTINWQGRDIAEIALPPLCASPPDGIPNLRTRGQLIITNEGAFEDFTYFLLTQPNFQWVLRSGTVRVRALGIAFSNTQLEKTIQLDAFNGLPGLVITQFAAPSDAPGRINIETVVPIPSPAALGVELGTATFAAFFKGSDIGRISSSNLFLAAKTTTVAQLNGYLSDQTNNRQGLINVGILFSQFLAGQNSTLQARGVSVVGPASGGQPIVWLTNAFQRFQTDVILPGHIYQIIYSIILSDLTVTVSAPDSYTIPSSNNLTTAMFSNPFGFGLKPLQAGPKITITYPLPQNIPTAQLDLPLLQVDAGTSRGPTDMQPLRLSFRNYNLRALDRPTFQAFFAKLADTTGADFGLRGTTDVIAQTQIGAPLITGIPFNVTTSLVGVNSFNGMAGISNVQVDAPANQYIGIHLVATLENPSALTLFTNGLTLPTVYRKYNVVIGRATIPKLGLIPGTNNINVLFEFMINPFNSSQVQEVLSLYLQPTDLMTQNPRMPNVLDLQINGAAEGRPPTPPLTDPYLDSLEPALEGIIANAQLTGISTAIAKRVDVYIPPTVLTDQIRAVICQLAGVPLLGSVLGTICTVTGGTTNSTSIFIQARLTAQNELPVQVALNHVSATVHGYQVPDPPSGRFAIFDYNFTGSGFILPPAITTQQPQGPVTSETIPNIMLTNDLVTSLALINHNINADIWIVATLSNGRSAESTGSYKIPGLYYRQMNIPTTYAIGTPDLNLPIPPGLQLPSSLAGLTTLLGLLINGGAVGGSILQQILSPLGLPSAGALQSALNANASLASAIGGFTSGLCAVLPLACPSGITTPAILPTPNVVTPNVVTPNVVAPNVVAPSVTLPSTSSIIPSVSVTLPSSTPSLSLPLGVRAEPSPAALVNEVPSWPLIRALLQEAERQETNDDSDEAQQKREL